MHTIVESGLKLTPSAIRKLAETNSLEVEHIIEAAFMRDEAIAQTLECLSLEYSWDHSNHSNENNLVPLGKWVKYANIFIREGYSGLVNSYSCEDYFPLKFLEEYTTIESVESVLYIAMKFKEISDLNFIKSICSAFNLLLSFKKKPSISEELRLKIRELLHSYFGLSLDELTLAILILALRGVGNASSVELIQKQRVLGGAWADTVKTSIRAIRKNA